MGQSLTLRARTQSPPYDRGFSDFALFETACGWMGLVGRNGAVQHLRIGFPNRAELQDALDPVVAGRESDWNPEVRAQLQAYAAGQRVNFSGVRCEFPRRTGFQQRVLDYVRSIPYGTVSSYGDVALAVGYPGAARAVGTVMASNRIPIIIPCHRVVAAGGKLGGYSAPRGIELKQWLLDLERAALPKAPR